MNGLCLKRLIPESFTRFSLHVLKPPQSRSWPVPLTHLSVDEGDWDVAVVGDHGEAVPELGEAQHHVGVAWGGGAEVVGGSFLLTGKSLPQKILLF